MTSAPHAPESADSIHSQVSMVTERSVNTRSTPPSFSPLLAGERARRRSAEVSLGLMGTKRTDGDSFQSFGFKIERGRPCTSNRGINRVFVNRCADFGPWRQFSLCFLVERLGCSHAVSSPPLLPSAALMNVFMQTSSGVNLIRKSTVFSLRCVSPGKHSSAPSPFLFLPQRTDTRGYPGKRMKKRKSHKFRECRKCVCVFCFFVRQSR